MTFSSYYLRKIILKGIAANKSDSSDGSGQSPLKTWKGFATPNDMKNKCDSQEEVKLPTLMGVWEELIPALKRV